MGQILRHQSPSVEAQFGYITALLYAYDFDSTRTSDLPYILSADIVWVMTDPNIPVLILAEPTEVYLDPVRVAVGQDHRIIKWAKSARERNDLGPWRSFFEFRLLLKDESMIRGGEIEVIRNKSRELFGPDVSIGRFTTLEFRRLLLASGNGAHPAKTAKNYPNFDWVRDQIGYKNVLYTNMIEEAARFEILPSLQTAFGREFLGEISLEQLTMGNALRAVAHEENHPFRRVSDVPLEELKATVNGVYAIVTSERFGEGDINSLLLAVIGAALYGRSQMQQARKIGDQDTQRGLEAYYTGDTILMNYLFTQKGFITDPSGLVVGMDVQTIKRGMGALMEDLNRVREEDISETVPQFYAQYNQEVIWDRFRLRD